MLHCLFVEDIHRQQMRRQGSKEELTAGDRGRKGTGQGSIDGRASNNSANGALKEHFGVEKRMCQMNRGRNLIAFVDRGRQASISQLLSQQARPRDRLACDNNGVITEFDLRGIIAYCSISTKYIIQIN